MLADFIEWNDVRMIEAGDGFGFGMEALDFVLAPDLIPANHLQRHHAIVLTLAGLVNDAHSAHAEFFQELVLTEAPRQLAAFSGRVLPASI